MTLPADPGPLMFESLLFQWVLVLIIGLFAFPLRILKIRAEFICQTSCRAPYRNSPLPDE
jgi:hypothetical protein